jgi:hypothetical protein
MPRRKWRTKKHRRLRHFIEQGQTEVTRMCKQSLIAILVGALLAAPSIAHAQTGQNSGHSAKLPHPVSEATLQRNVRGLQLPNQINPAPARNCSDIACPGFALVGIGF